jgi:hypothetical protein
MNEQAKTPRLQIPRKFLRNAPQSEKKSADAGRQRLPLTMAGLALTAAFTSGGLWLVRRGNRRRIVAGGLTLALFAAGATALWADLAPRPRPRPPVVPPLVALPAAVQFDKQIVLEIVDQGDAIKLLVSPKLIGKLAGDKPEANAPLKD